MQKEYLQGYKELIPFRGLIRKRELFEQIHTELDFGN